MMLGLVLGAVCAGAANAAAITVPWYDLEYNAGYSAPVGGYRNTGLYVNEFPGPIPPLPENWGGLDGANWGGEDLEIRWNITLSESTWTYDYWFVSSAAVDEWYLEVSPELANPGAFSYAENVVATLGAGGGIGNALHFTADDGSGHYIFTTGINPVYGDAYMIGTEGETTYTAQNNQFGVEPGGTDADFYSGWVATVDSTYASDEIDDIIIPEPSTAVLALTALVGGAFARRRKKRKADAA